VTAAINTSTRDLRPPELDRLDCLLLENEDKPARERLTLVRLFEELALLNSNRRLMLSPDLTSH
jgi:hypothetical protein